MSTNILALPAPDRGWVLTSDGVEVERSEDLIALVGTRGEVVIGLPAGTVSTFVVDLPLVDAALHESMIHAQIEKRGLAGKGGVLFDFESLARDAENETMSVSVVTDLAPETIVANAGGYTTSAALRASVPAEGCVAILWSERGRLVMGVFVNGHPAHVQVLSGKPEIGNATGKEINLMLLGLKGESLFEKNPPRELILAIYDVSEKALIELRSALSVPVKMVAASPVARVGEGRERLLPAAVKMARRRRKAIVRGIAILAAGFVIYAVAGVWIWKEAQATKGEIASLERSISIIEPDVERVQLAEERWRNMEPAFDKDFFPVVQLSRITAALPGSGVVIREYRTSGRSIRIRGQARDVQLANRLLEDLETMEGFEAYQWSLPNPKVEKNNTATFEIEGKPKNEGADS